jgi:hypothetical protein
MNPTDKNKHFDNRAENRLQAASISGKIRGDNQKGKRDVGKL